MKTLQKTLTGGGLSLVLAFCAAGCSHRGSADPLRQNPGRACQDPEALVDVLSRFATAVSKRDYYSAISLLGKADQAKMIDSTGAVPEMIQRQLNALNFQALAKNPKVDLVSGRLTGIFDCLPCLDASDAPPVAQQETVAQPAAPAGGEKTREDEKRRRDLAIKFYRDIRDGRWNAVARSLHPQERETFLFEKSEFSEWDKKRLRGVQECDLDALTLKDGQLVGVALLLQPPVSDLWLRSSEFFNLIDSGNMEKALAMMVDSEKRRFLDPDGKLRPDRAALLRNLDRGQWQKFSLYGNYLMGVSEAVLGYGSL